MGGRQSASISVSDCTNCNSDDMFDRLEKKLILSIEKMRSGKNCTMFNTLLVAYVQYRIVDDIESKIKKYSLDIDPEILDYSKDYANYLWNKTCLSHEKLNVKYQWSTEKLITTYRDTIWTDPDETIMNARVKCCYLIEECKNILYDKIRSYPLDILDILAEHQLQLIEMTSKIKNASFYELVYIGKYCKLIQTI